MIHNVVSISGGKDSTAMALLAIERETENLSFVFCDTGHEHQQTYDYVEYLDGELQKRCGAGITTVRANFDDRIKAKRERLVRYLLDSSACYTTDRHAKGWFYSALESAIDVLRPTGNPFLDLCLWKGRFPSTKARFCTTELKHDPVNNFVAHVMETGPVISWHGVRADESPARANLPERDVEIGSWEPEPQGHLIYRPIIRWTAADVFAFHDRHGVKPNPLYKQGMGRVGCMPCVNVNKAELAQIALRFPEEIGRVAEWERVVSRASKRGSTTFIFPGNDSTVTFDEVITPEKHGIHRMVEWAKTTRGGRQYDLIATSKHEASVCHSVYGLCE